MFLKRLKLTNYRKFSAEQNVVEFISSKIVKNRKMKMQKKPLRLKKQKRFQAKLARLMLHRAQH